MFNYKAKINHKQMCLTKEQYDALVANFNRGESHPEYSSVPVVRFFATWSMADWHLIDLNPETGDAFGCCDLGIGFPELGYVNLNEFVQACRGRAQVERDLHFNPNNMTIQDVLRAKNERQMKGSHA